MLATVPSLAQAKYASIVVDFRTGQVLHQVNADTRNYPASLTKMMTLYMTFEALQTGKLSLKQKLIVSRRAAGMPASKLGLRRGSTITVEQAILALVTKSANDVAVVLAEALGGTESEFAVLMTQRAQSIGMTRTTFRNASGLPNRRQLSTARDMATLSRRLILDYPKQYRYFSTQSFTYGNRKHRNHNKLLRTYRGADGIKTGYIRASGFNLAASAVRDNRRLVAVVFGGKTSGSRNRHMAKLLDKGFKRVAVAQPLLPPPPRKPAVTKVAYGVENKGQSKTITISAAPPKPTVAPPKPTAMAKSGRWGVQVGAYYRESPARDAAMQAAERLPDLLGQAVVMTPTITGDRGKIYRARLMGIQEGDARKACSRLKSAKIDCLVVQLPKNLKLAAQTKPSG
ncbi:MAG: D-alanyl-D-alanine carboxypeptidase [Pseudomonadota bacterium]